MTWLEDRQQMHRDYEASAPDLPTRTQVSDELVERLRGGYFYWQGRTIAHDAADLIESQAATIAKLEGERDTLQRVVAALAGWVEELDPDPARLVPTVADGTEGAFDVGAYLTLTAEIYAARAALASIEGRET